MTVSDDFIPFTRAVKIYVYKDKNEVSVNFRISDNCVYSDMMTLSQFQYIIDNWQQGHEGIETSMGKVYWERRRLGPRPEQAPCDFVAINFFKWCFRITTEEMFEVEKDFYRQLKGKNHWD